MYMYYTYNIRVGTSAGGSVVGASGACALGPRDFGALVIYIVLSPE